MSIFDLVAFLLTITAVFAFLNAKTLKLPTEIGVLVIGLAASLLLIGVQVLVGDAKITRQLTVVLSQIDFRASLLNGILAFMLFAGALHVDWQKLKTRAAS